jgi:hypothetical protein
MPRLEPVMTATLPVRSNGVPFTARAPFLFLIGLSFATRHCEERSDEAIQLALRRDGLLRGVYHRAAPCADPVARNDG